MRPLPVVISIEYARTERGGIMARRMAGIRRRKDGTFEKRFTIEGQRYSVYGKTQKECIENEMKRREEIRNGLYTKNRKITVDQYFQEWIERKAEHVSANTIRRYRNDYRGHILPALGKKKLKDIERREILSFQKKLLGEGMPVMASTVIMLLNQIMKSAVEDEIIARNVCAGIKSPKAATNAGETIHRALTAEEIEIFLKYAKTDISYNVFRLMLETGMRAGECCALQWRDIDYKNGVIHIRRTVTADETGKAIIGKTTKTRKSIRDIPINTKIRMILQDQRALYDMMYGGGKVLNIEALIFTGERMCILSSTHLNSKIKSILKQAEKAGEAVRPFSSHALRDTFASMAALKGVPMNVLKELLGHNSYAMTADKYCHTYEEQKREAMEGISIAK